VRERTASANVRMPVDARVTDVRADTPDIAIIRAIVRLGRELNSDVLAEGVETADQLELVRHLGCTHAQGFYFGRPSMADDARRLLATPPITT